jgi:hypothetical protein
MCKRSFFSRTCCILLRNFELVFGHLSAVREGQHGNQLNSGINALIDNAKLPQWSEFALTSFHTNILS